MRLIVLMMAGALVTGCATTRTSQPLSQPVATDKGLVSGTGDAVRAFKGIPYAKAPTGELRWKPPQSPDSWVGVRDGSQFGRDCVQPDEYPELRGGGMSEDCLSVNVWTPARQSGEKLPVLVWLYGGGFTYGSGSHPSYDGEAMARRGVVVVNLNYRVGLLGFMAHPQLTAQSPTKASGNYALMDQIEALKWVQRNIAAFGGDPSKVTVAAQSAGALAVSSLMTSDQAKGLFHQAILQSVGVMRPMSTLKDAERSGLQVGADIAALRQVPASELVKRLQGMVPKVRNVTGVREIGVIVDGDVVKEPDYVAFPAGRFANMPMIVGSNENEGGGAARGMKIATASQLDAYVRSNFPGMEQRAAQAYSARTDADALPVLSDLVSDTQYLYGTREMLRLAAARQPKLYRYVFAQPRNGSSATPIHGAELQYVFDNLSAPHRGRVIPSNATDANVALSMADAWARFVKTGNPNGAGAPAWPSYTADSRAYLQFGPETVRRVLAEQPRLDLIEQFYSAQRRRSNLGE